MDLDEFAELTAAWVNPWILLECARQYSHERSNAVRPSTYLFTCPPLHGAEDELCRVVADFVERFRVPNGVIEMMSEIFGPEFGADSVDWLRSMRFEGELVQPREEHHALLPPAMSGWRPLLLIQERDAVTELLAAPCQTLLGAAASIAGTWGLVVEKGQQSHVFHQQHSAGPWFAYLDRRIAAAMCARSDLGDCGLRAEQPAFVWRYRAVTLASNMPAQPVDLDVARDLSTGLAEETRQPPAWRKGGDG